MIKWWTLSFIAIVAAFASGIAGTVWAQSQSSSRPTGPKHFFDLHYGAEDRGLIAFYGVLEGRDVAGKPIMEGECVRKRADCRITTLNQVGGLNFLNTTHFEIEQWGTTIVARDDFPLCVSVTLKIDRAAQEVLYIRSPKPNVAADICKEISQETFMWRIG